MQTKIEEKLWKRVRFYLKFLQVVPFLRMIAVCNNLSFGKVDKNSDIDLFVVAASGRLFFVRTFVTSILHLLGVRRHSNKVSGRFCLSFFMDDSNLSLRQIALKDDYYLKLWIEELTPVINNNCYADFINANSWAIKSNFHSKEGYVLSRNLFLWIFNSFFTFLFKGRFGNKLERSLSDWQLKRAKTKGEKLNDKSGIIIKPTLLKFHNVDRRKHYNNLWEKNYGKQEVVKEKFLPLLK
ncbi:hypothetical protein GF354_02150 [Candidatus Peregrinibacteria bacterium]|nr:hypothetical protein [Candidatus Peregrinibacteria bacterium]